MTRWEPDARGRLEEAALTLYNERGFEQTTVAEIAKRAGLTERTFFRHFSDKREVLFGGGSVMQGLIVETVAAAPSSATPIAAAAAAVGAAGAMIQERAAYSRRRQAVISANPELQERELIKLSALGEALAGALRERGAAPATASLIAEVAIAVFKAAFVRWHDEGESGELPALIAESFTALNAAATSSA